MGWRVGRPEAAGAFSNACAGGLESTVLRGPKTKGARHHTRGSIHGQRGRDAASVVAAVTCVATRPPAPRRAAAALLLRARRPQTVPSRAIGSAVQSTCLTRRGSKV